MELKIIKRGGRKIKGFVYALKHNVTGKIYIGSTRDPKTRLQAHFRALRTGKHPQRQMQLDSDKYGIDFTVYLLHEGELSKRDLMEIEYLYMTVFKTRDARYGYNTREETKDHKISDFPVISQNLEIVSTEKLQRKRASRRATPRPLM